MCAILIATEENTKGWHTMDKLIALAFVIVPAMVIPITRGIILAAFGF